MISEDHVTLKTDAENTALITEINYILIYMWPWSTKPVISVNLFKFEIFPLMYGLDNICKSESAK